MELGISKGETVLIRADIGQIIKSSNNIKPKDFLQIILSIVGDDGTIIAPAYTQSSYVKRNKKNILKILNSEKTWLSRKNI